jgi:hypothetical protein
LRAASTTHLRGIDAHFLSLLEADDTTVIERSMDAVAQAAERSSDACDSSPVARRER